MSSKNQVATTEDRVSINQENVWVRAKDLRDLDAGRCESIPVYRTATSASPTGRKVEKGDIWERADKRTKVKLPVRDLEAPSGMRWVGGSPSASA